MNDRRADHCPVARLQSAFAPILIAPMEQMCASIRRLYLQNVLSSSTRSRSKSIPTELSVVHGPEGHAGLFQ